MGLRGIQGVGLIYSLYAMFFFGWGGREELHWQVRRIPGAYIYMYSIPWILEPRAAV